MSRKPNTRIQFMLDRTDYVLSSHGIKILQDNDDFIKNEFSYENHVLYTTFKKGCVELRLTFNEHGTGIGINGFHEVYDFSYDDISSSSKQYEEYLSRLLLNSVIIKKCFFGFNFIYTRNSDGQVELLRKIYEGFAALLLLPLSTLPMGCKCVEYRPLYHLSESA